MPTSVQQKLQSEPGTEKMRCVSVPAAQIPTAEPDDWRLNTSEQLQSTLDLPALLTLFLSRISELVSLDGLSFRNEAENTEWNIARQASHSCGYRIIAGQTLIGELVFSRSSKFNEQELELLESAIALIINPLKNALQYHKAVEAALRDPLTGAGNRAALETILLREMELAKRHNQPLSILMLAVNDLDEILTTHGRAMADGIRQDLVRRTREVCRDTDVVFRIDGDCYLLLLNQADASEASLVTERLIQKFNGSCRTKIGELVKFQVRIGLATLTGTDSFSSMIDRAYRSMDFFEGNPFSCAAKV